MKNKKAMILRFRKNFLDIEFSKALMYGLNQAGYEVEDYFANDVGEEIDNFDVESYDLILFSPIYNSLWNSGTHYNAYMMEEIMRRSKPYTVAMFVCDLQLASQVKLWDKGENHVTHKRNVLDSKPIYVFGSIEEAVLNEEKGEELVNRLWMRGLHPDSKLIFIEWLSLLYHTYPKTVDEDIKMPDLQDGEKIRNFYYGVKRPHISKSLDDLGLNSEEDLIYGANAIANDKVRIIDFNRRKYKDSLTWIKLANRADKILIPYEPIKSDYQLSLRFLEAMRFYKDKALVDNRVNSEYPKYIHDEQMWINKSNEVIEQLKKLKKT